MEIPGYFGHIELQKNYLYSIFRNKKDIKMCMFYVFKLKLNKEQHKHCLKMDSRKDGIIIL